MTMQKTFEVEKNGYRMFIIEDSDTNYKSLEIRQDNDDLPYLNLDKPSRMHSIFEDDSFEDMKITITTRSIGSKSVEQIKEMINQYELAIETVEHFKAEILKYKEDK